MQTPTKAQHPFQVEEDTPLLARDVDLVAWSSQNLNDRSNQPRYFTHPPVADGFVVLFLLPASIRKNVYKYCFLDEPRKVSLSPHFATKAIFAKDHFASPWDVLHPVHGALHAFSLIRTELMEYFWAEFHFHVTLSMFSGPKFSPLSHVFLPEYIHIVQHLTLEVDLTRFGGSALKNGHEFGHNYYKIEQQITDVVDGLLLRTKSVKIFELNLMCRRFEGFRPSQEPKNNSLKCLEKGDDLPNTFSEKVY